MSTVKDLLASNFHIEKIIEKVGDIADNHHTSREEKDAHKLQMLQEILRHKLSERQQDTIDNKSAADNVTERWKTDMSTKDSWLSKNIRPLTLGTLVVFLLIATFADSFVESFSVKESWISFWRYLTGIAFGAYFSGRTVEKTMSIYRSDSDYIHETHKNHNQYPDDTIRLQQEITRTKKKIKSYSKFTQDQIDAERAEIERQKKMIAEERERLSRS